MGVKYVKDFSFPSAGGFHSSSVQRYAKGGHVTKVPAKAAASAKGMPARAKPNAPAKGAPKMESKPSRGKRQGYEDGGPVRATSPILEEPIYGALEDMASRTSPQPVGVNRPGRDEFGQPISYFGDVPNMPPPAANPREAAMQRSAELRAKAAQSSAANRARTAGIRAMLAKNRPMVEEARSTRDSILAGMSPEKRAATQAKLAQSRANRQAQLAEAAAARKAALAARRAAPVGPRTPTPAFAKGGAVKGEKIAKVMREYKAGKLHSGSKKGPVVKNPKQAMAIALSEARAAKKAKGGEVFSDEYMAYESKGPKTRYTAAKGRRMSKERAMERRALDKARHAEKYAPGMSLDMSEYKKGGKVKHSDVKMDKAMVKKAVHKHERAMHPGKPMTKLNKGGVPSYGRKAMYGGGKC